MPGSWRAWSRTFGHAGLLAAPVVWVGAELLRAHTFFQFPWCQLGYSQYRHIPVIQLASVTAVYGVSFVLVASSALLAYLALEHRSRRRPRRLVALAPPRGSDLGGRRLGHEPSHRRDRHRSAWAWSRAGSARRTSGSRAAPGATSPPTSSSPTRRRRRAPASSSGRSRRCPSSSTRTPPSPTPCAGWWPGTDVWLFFGNDDRETDAEGESRIFVGAKLLEPGGEITLRYHKIQLVPFGEYVPLQPLFTLGGRYAAKMVQEVSDFTPGTEPALAEVDGHLVGGYICYEAIFPALARRFAAQGAELLVNVTNDAWYGTTSAPYQHLAMAAFRAVENRRYMVRAANTGITAVVDPWGRILEPTPLFERTILVRDVPFVAEKSFYTRHGDLFARACLAAALALLAATVRRPGNEG